MSRTVQCMKLGKEADGLDFTPYPGKLGQKIFDQISQEAWQMWLRHQTMLINENRLRPMDPKSRKYLEGEMEKFLFGEGSALPEGFTPPPSE